MILTIQSSLFEKIMIIQRLQFIEFYTSFKGDMKSIRDYIKRWSVWWVFVYEVKYDENLTIELK